MIQSGLPEDASGRDLIVVGASSGGMSTLTRLIAQLPADLPAAICVVLHLAPQSPGVLAQIIGRDSALPASQVEEDTDLDLGHVYVAPPNRHLLVEPGRLRLWCGPRENRARPAIDPLFRSAADAYGARAVGVVLTGALDDGIFGLEAIKRAGGIAVVQDPEEAPYPSMPQSALDYVSGVDYTLPVAEMGDVLEHLARTPIGQPSPSPLMRPSSRPSSDDPQVSSPPSGGESIPDAAARANADAKPGGDASAGPRAMAEKEEENHLVNMGCPACGGPLEKLSAEALHSYRCHEGHRYTARALLAGQDEAAERALWVALRTLEERHRMLRRMAHDAQEGGRSRMAERYEERAGETQRHAEKIRTLLSHFTSPLTDVPPERSRSDKH